MIDIKHQEYFKKLLGEENAYFDELHLHAYSYDATRKKILPNGVLFPKNTQDVSDILKYCNQNLIKIVPRGAGSGFTGGSLSNGGIILAFEKYMNKILEIDTQNLVAVVEPGVINSHLNEALKEHGLFYPPDPASLDYSTLGGNVAENSGGMKATKYGITKDYVMALEAVLPNGDIVNFGKRTIKDVAGYNMVGTLIASEGTLAVITKITLKIIAKPKLSKTALGIFDSVDDAMNAVFKTLASGVVPVSMEFLDNLCIRAVEERFKKGLPVDAGALLIADVDGNVPEALEHDIAILKESFMKNGAKDFIIAKDETQRNDIWFARRNCSQAINCYGSLKLNEDITVPRSKLTELLRKNYEIGEKYGVLVPCFGHTGDGNVHTNVMVKDKNDPVQVENGYKAIEEIFKATVELGGTLSGEHGIGIAKAPFMHLAFSKEELAIMKAIKNAFDPNNILNPDKMGI